MGSACKGIGVQFQGDIDWESDLGPINMPVAYNKLFIQQLLAQINTAILIGSFRAPRQVAMFHGFA